jgi:hypothetical membrane protein
MLGGIIGPVLFTTVILICASLRPDYSHIAQFISELGATGTSNAMIMNWIGFIPSGLMISLFGTSLTTLLPKSPIARIGSILILVFGLGMVVAGNFSCDIGCPREGSLENSIHDKISGAIFVLVVIGILLLGISFRYNPRMRSLWIYSVISAFLALIFLMVLISSIESYTTTGLWQRLFLGTIFLWCVIVGYQMLKATHGVEVVSAGNHTRYTGHN